MAIRNTDLGGTDYQDTGSTQLDGAINDSVTTITVDSTASFKSSGIILIDDELVNYTGTTATTFTGCTRGYLASTAASHTDNTSVDEKEVVFADDLNDTFDAAYSKIQSLSAFWLNSDLYDVYEDFNSITVGSFAGNADWTVTTNNGGTCSISATTKAGGTTRELKLFAESNSSGATREDASCVSQTLDNNKHTFARIYFELEQYRNDGDNACQVSMGSGWYTVASHSNPSSGNQGATGFIKGYTNLLIVAKGSNVYDLYVGGKLLGNNVSVGNLEVGFNVYAENAPGVASADAQTYMYIDDIRQAKSETS